VEGTLGNRIKNGLKEVSLFGPDGKIEMVKCDMRVESIEGFSGHSDRNQLLGFIKRMMPKPTRIIVNHGERRKSELFAQNVNIIQFLQRKRFHVERRVRHVETSIHDTMIFLKTPARTTLNFA